MKKVTLEEKAKLIVQAWDELDVLPSRDDKMVQYLVRTNTSASIDDLYRAAQLIFKRKERKTWRKHTRPSPQSVS